MPIELPPTGEYLFLAFATTRCVYAFRLPEDVFTQGHTRTILDGARKIPHKVDVPPICEDATAAFVGYTVRVTVYEGELDQFQFVGDCHMYVRDGRRCFYVLWRGARAGVAESDFSLALYGAGQRAQRACQEQAEFILIDD